MTSRLPATLTSADLPLAELSGARLDGELFALAGAWCPVDAPEGPETRAGALASVSPSRAVAERMSAAWIYGLAAEPDRHQFCVDVSRRTRKQQGSTLQLREVRLRPADVRTVGRQLVTTPLRTAVDLARWGRSPGCPADTALLAELIAYDGDADRLEDAGDLGCGAPSPGRSIVLARGTSFSKVAAAQLTEACRLARHAGETSRR